MKILYFFDILDVNFRENYYFTLRKKEINKHITEINRGNKVSKISSYCLNKGKSFLISKGFNKEISCVMDEYMHIKRDVYMDIVHIVWTNVREFMRDLTKNPLENLNYLFDIMENNITRELLIMYETFEFIKAIIKRENPKVVFFSEKNDSFYRNLKKELELNDIKFLYLKSHINYFYDRFNKFLFCIWNFFFDFKKFFRFKLEFKKKRRFPINRKEIFIGISAPGYLLGTMELTSVMKQLKKENIKFRVFNGMVNMLWDPTLATMKFKYVSLSHLRFVKKYLNNSRIKNLLLKDIKSPLKEYAYLISKKEFIIEILKVLYILRNYKLEIEKSEYKVILINNEFGEAGKSINYVCKNYGIPVYFIPYCGIVRRESDVTPHLTDFISVDGVLDKEYLTKKGVDSNKILVRGSPKYESVLKKSFIPLKEIKDHFTGKNHLISQEKYRILLTTTTFREESNLIILKAIVNVLKNLNNIQFIIKLHPNQDGRLERKVLRDLNQDAIIVKDVDILEIIKTADVLLTEESSVILDSMVVGTPIICLDFINKGVSFSAKHVYNDEKFIIIIHDEQELNIKLNELLNSPIKIKEYKKLMKKNLKSILYYENNYSPAQHIVADLKKIINSENRK